MSAVARRPDYRNDNARELRNRIHADLRTSLVREAQAAREQLFWDAVIEDLDRSVGDLRS